MRRRSPRVVHHPQKHDAGNGVQHDPDQDGVRGRAGAWLGFGLYCRRGEHHDRRGAVHVESTGAPTCEPEPLPSSRLGADSERSMGLVSHQLNLPGRRELPDQQPSPVDYIPCRPPGEQSLADRRVIWPSP